ncbi:unnamed protein product, partial [Closterium sp. Naga37s-1]
MVSYRSVLQTVEAALGPDGRRGKQLTAAQRGDLFYALSLVEDDLRSDPPSALCMTVRARRNRLAEKPRNKQQRAGASWWRSRGMSSSAQVRSKE